ncbi:TMEM175 family protein [uncultured Amnibacterium sp.]|uniref:TMEM175 family protein n=1 Tax=uncultured Amnibacterium sp. TaxID=1631851 RepID=UPI0035CA1BF8
MEDDRGRSAERLVTFTDAVVAIAITLLALPLADIVREVSVAGGDLGDVVRDAAIPLLGFTISFFVISRLWWAHHRIFQHVVRWDARLVQLTILWLFTIVLLAPITGLTGLSDPTDGTGSSTGEVAIYIGAMTVSSALLSALARHVRRRPQLTDGHDDDAEHRLFVSVETTLSFALALVIGTVLPFVHYFALLTLVVTGQIGRLVWNRRHRAP